MFKLGFSSVSGNGLRSFLTVLGIVMGIATMITVICVGGAGEAQIYGELKNFGIDRILIYSADTYYTGMLTLEDKELLENNLDECLVSASTFLRLNLEYEGLSVSADVSGTTPELADMDNKSMQEGRFLNEADYSLARKNVVLSQAVAQELFGENPAQGENIEISGVNYTVVGVEANTNELMSSFVSPKCYIPISTLNEQFSTEYIGELAVSAARADVDYVHRVSAELLLEKYGTGSVKVINLSEQMQYADNIISIFTLVVGAVALVSLLVGGVGIMNMMLVSVRERKREIGLAKALGATNGKIMMQFLSESVIYSVLGAIFGVLLGAGLTHIAGAVILIDAKITPYSLLISVGFSFVVGVVFGIVPALRAANLNPVVALRS